jgi:hypothetical protein
MATKAGRFKATEYTGRALDWYHLDQVEVQDMAGLEQPVVEMVPNQLGFRDAPHARWSRFEDAEEVFDTAFDPEPNVLSMLLPEFFYIDINNWYLIPAPMPTGNRRQVTKLVVGDSFGVATELGPASDADWRLFVPSSPDGGPVPGARALMAPNVAVDIVENDVVEDVRFVCDEGTNLVWAFEQLYHTADGRKVTNADGMPRAASLHLPRVGRRAPPGSPLGLQCPHRAGEVVVAGRDADVAALALLVSLAPAQPQHQPLGAEVQVRHLERHKLGSAQRCGETK